MGIFRRTSRRRTSRQIADEVGKEAAVEYVLPGLFRVLGGVVKGFFRLLD